ncbi:MAG: Ribonuclease 3 [Candidatus Marinimicrobia bacterium]|nr:Ribonuclease 3 [Candidatus Neomarinimicrobiota bacterium]
MGFLRRLLSKYFSRVAPQDENLASISKRIKYNFSNPDLLSQALTHPSLAREQLSPLHTYERLEFLGDAVLELIISDYLFRFYPNFPEGALTKKRSALVNKNILASIGKEIGLPEFIKSQSVADRPIEESEAVVGDVVEAIIGAAYIDGGMKAARKIVLHLFPLHDSTEGSSEDRMNFKGVLIEYCHTHDQPEPIFQTVDRIGPDHSRQYKVAVLLNKDVVATGKGSSKKKAGQAAAKHALSRLSKDENRIEGMESA